jgi:hypothetical protein
MTAAERKEHRSALFADLYCEPEEDAEEDYLSGILTWHLNMAS